MKKRLLIVGVVGLVALLAASVPILAQGPGMMGGPGWGYAPGNTQGYTNTNPYGYGPGMMGGRGMMWGGRGMMGGFGWGYAPGNTQGYTNTNPYGYGPGMMWGGRGMMGGRGYHMWGGRGMMGGCPACGGNWGWGGAANPAAEPLSLSEAEEAVQSYLTNLGDSNLILDEVMIFDNHAYAQVVEADTGLGAMELLVDPVTQAIYPEMGPNMMWNTKYGHMSGYYGAAPAEMSVSPEQAVELAQNYLAGSGLQVDEHADPFYGYYTLHTLRDGEVAGMLSVNGYTGQVFLHTWHGNFIEMSEGHSE